MNINFPINQRNLGILNMSLNGDILAATIRHEALEVVAAAMRNQTKSYITAEALENPNYCSLKILPDMKLSVTLYSDRSYHGSSEPEKTEYIVTSPYAVSLIVSAYHLESAKMYDGTCKVELVEQADDKKEKD